MLRDSNERDLILGSAFRDRSKLAFWTLLVPMLPIQDESPRRRKMEIRIKNHDDIAWFNKCKDGQNSNNLAPWSVITMLSRWYCYHVMYCYRIVGLRSFSAVLLLHRAPWRKGGGSTPLSSSSSCSSWFGAGQDGHCLVGIQAKIQGDFLTAPPPKKREEVLCQKKS